LIKKTAFVGKGCIIESKIQKKRERKKIEDWEMERLNTERWRR
jgi:hypothetical protein